MFISKIRSIAAVATLAVSLMIGAVGSAEAGQRHYRSNDNTAAIIAGAAIIGTLAIIASRRGHGHDYHERRRYRHHERRRVRRHRFSYGQTECPRGMYFLNGRCNRVYRDNVGRNRWVYPAERQRRYRAQRPRYYPY